MIKGLLLILLCFLIQSNCAKKQSIFRCNTTLSVNLFESQDSILSKTSLNTTRRSNNYGTHVVFQWDVYKQLDLDLSVKEAIGYSLNSDSMVYNVNYILIDTKSSPVPNDFSQFCINRYIEYFNCVPGLEQMMEKTEEGNRNDSTIVVNKVIFTYDKSDPEVRVLNIKA